MPPKVLLTSLARSTHQLGDGNYAHNTYDTAHKLGQEDRHELTPDLFEVEVERHAKSHDGRFEPEVDLTACYLVCLVADASEFQERDENCDGDKDWVEHNPSCPFLQL